MLQIYNSLSRTKEPFKTVEPGRVRMYVCGMTVYDFCHLGHARMLVSFDVVARWLRTCGYHLHYVRNITDIDDKIINKALHNNQSLLDVTSFYTSAMHADEAALGVQSPDSEPRATEHVPDMLDIIQRLEEKGLAYKADDGDVNYAVRKFPDYGKLSGKSLDDLQAGERVAVSTSKHDPLDFVLWKAAKESEPDDSKWESKYGQGRPGWHIECSAMSRALLGLPLDIHGGGPDLKFPHHENEIAQTEGAFDGEMSSFWMHCGPLMVNDDKMSKSLGNFSTIRSIIGVPETVLDAQATYKANIREAEMLRFFIVRNHYRSIQNYAASNLIDAQNALDRLYQTLHNVPPAKLEINWEQQQAKAFKAAMNDDFNTAEAVAVLFDLATEANRTANADVSGLMRELGAILGLLQHEPAAYLQTSTRYQHNASGVSSMSADNIELLVKARNQAKADKNYQKADQIRDQLHEHGIELEDKPGGITQWRYK